VSVQPEHLDLIRQIKQGDAHSFELLFRRLYPRMCAYAQKFLHDMNDAEEIVQEVFYAVWKHRDYLDEQQSLHAYLFTAVKNKSLNLLETKKNRTRHAEVMWFLYAQESLENNTSYEALLVKDLEKDLSAALSNLPQECRKIFELSRFEGLKYQEIAARLNISIKTVETQMSRALSKLRLQLREHITILILLDLLK
jgi:RNA polymerase sigma-70 factor (ECF subfamily)